MIRVYIAGAYRDGRGVNAIRTNIRAAELVGQELALLAPNICPIVPHLLWGLWDGLKSDSYFLECGKSVLSVCSAVVVLPSWRHSIGTQKEIKLAQKMGKRIFYYPNEINKLLEYVSSVEWSVVNDEN